MPREHPFRHIPAQPKPPAVKSVTKRHRACFAFIAGYLAREGGVSPSFDEIKDAISLKSKSGVWELVNDLKGWGYLRAIPGRRRCFEIIRTFDKAPRPDGNAPIQIPVPGPAPAVLRHVELRGLRLP